LEGDPEPPLATHDSYDETEEIYRALCLGLGDYVRKNGFSGVVIGLSGGIDSALTAAVATDALGPDAVRGVTMPSRYSSSGSVEDSRVLAANLGIAFDEISVEPPFTGFLEALGGAFELTEVDVAEQNLQARARGAILMALSNKFGGMVVATGNKSEMSVGYATLYGDMVGGYAVLKDVSKTLVYELARWRNRAGEVIPKSTIDKPPSAELKPDQKDTDSLPPYEVLDPILERYVEDDASVKEIVEDGFEEKTVRQIARMVDRNEYKRRQAAPGVRITTKSLGRDRRLPITNKYGD
jgi:NAD+ synthase (glutamine-hydrolysing)